MSHVHTSHPRHALVPADWSDLAGSGLRAAILRQRKLAITLHDRQLPTRDAVTLDVVVSVRWQIQDLRKSEATVTQRLSRLVQALLRDAIGSSTLAELLTGQIEVERRLYTRLHGDTAGWGIRIRSAQIVDFAIPIDVRAQNDARLLQALRLCRVRFRDTQVS